MVDAHTSWLSVARNQFAGQPSEQKTRNFVRCS